MKTGHFERTYEKNKTHWIVKGFSEREKRYVYPHEGWSWTSWQPYVSDTYKSLKEAKSAISSGYLHSMIEHQKIVDINFFEIVTTKKIVESQTVRSFNRSGKATKYQEPNYARGLQSLSSGDYLILSDGGLYGQVRYVRDGVMAVDILNGGWTLILDVTTEQPTIHASSSNMSHRVGEPVSINHLGVPNENASRGDYSTQMEYYREHFDQAALTSTLRTAISA